jgi:hypothetical protein
LTQRRSTLIAPRLATATAAHLNPSCHSGGAGPSHSRIPPSSDRGTANSPPFDLHHWLLRLRLRLLSFFVFTAYRLPDQWQAPTLRSTGLGVNDAAPRAACGTTCTCSCVTFSWVELHAESVVVWRLIPAQQ